MDLPFSPDGQLPKLGGPFSDGFNAAFFDGSTQFFKKEIYADDKALRTLAGWNDGEVVNLRPYQEPPLPPPPKDSPAHAAVESVRRINSIEQPQTAGPRPAQLPRRQPRFSLLCDRR